MKDIIYQESLEYEIDNLLLLPIDKLKLFEDYGSKEVYRDNVKIQIGWWKYQLNEHLIHFVFKTSRRSLLIFHKPFLDGIKVTENKIERLTNLELGEYD